MTVEQNNLVEQNMRFAYSRASGWNKRQTVLDYDELCSIALLGLTKAAISYDKSKNNNFLSYAKVVIENEIKTQLNKENNYIKNKFNTATRVEIEERMITFDNIGESLRLKTAIAELPQLYQKILFDFYEASLSQYEIADKYNISQTKVSIILKKAKEILATSLK